MGAIFTPTRLRISVERYQRMVATGVLTKNDRVELIEGEMIEMAPIGTRHTAVTARLNQWLVLRLANRAIMSPGGAVDLGDFSEPQPDLMLLKPRADFYEQKHPEAQDVLLLIEVSESSLAFDQSTKLAMYARYGVNEYWIVDLVDKRLVVYRQPTPAGSYLQKIEVRDGDKVTPLAFPDLQITLSDVFG
jgi:Uma2 family endonuclease